MSSEHYEAAYETHRQSPAILALFDRWSAGSANYRATHSGFEEGQHYGTGDRDRYDYAPAADDADSPLVVFIHGGYWQGGNRSNYSFMAAAFNAAGWSLALPSYRLCPDVEVREIADDLERFLHHLRGRWPRRPIALVGHSAGAHLAAALLLRAPRDALGRVMVDAGVGISGVYDLAPLIHTRLNERLRLTPSSAAAASVEPAALPPSICWTAAFGMEESAEFDRQSRLWTIDAPAGADVELLELPSRNHYTILSDLAEPQSRLFASVERAVRHAVQRAAAESGGSLL